MRRYGLVRRPFPENPALDVWEHPSGRMWCIRLTDSKGNATARERGLWEIIQIGQWGAEVRGEAPMSLKHCAAVIHDALSSQSEPIMP